MFVHFLTRTVDVQRRTPVIRARLRRLSIERLEDRRLLSLGTYSLLEGPSAGSDSDVVNIAEPWTATANASWLHTSASGNGSGTAPFTFDANPGPTRTGTLTIAGAVLTVTQAADGNVAVGSLTTLVPSPLFRPQDVALDSSHNVYVADTGHNAIKEWNPATKTVSTLVSTGLNSPQGLAVDAAGNVYVDDNGNNAIKEWNFATNTVTTLVSGLNNPQGMSMDAAGNVYIADTGNSVIKMWNAATKTVSTVVSSGLSHPSDVAVDSAGNLYIAGVNDNAIREWNAATQTLSVLVTVTSVNNHYRLAVAAWDNLYIDDSYDGQILVWNAAAHKVVPLISSGLSLPSGIAVDGAGNVFITDQAHCTLNAWNSSTKTLSPLLASAVGVAADLTVGGAGDVYIADGSRTNAIDKWDAVAQTITTVVPADPTFSWQDFAADSASDFFFFGDRDLEERNASTQSVSVLCALPFDEPTGIAVDGAGNVYFQGHDLESLTTEVDEWNAATQTISALFSQYLNLPEGLAADASGNVYINDALNQTIIEWNAATKTTNTLVTSGLTGTQSLAADAAGNVYSGDGGTTIKEWNRATGTLSTLISSGLSQVKDLAVDAEGNIYVDDEGDNTIKELPRAFVRSSPVVEGAGAGSDSLAAVLSAGQSLTGVFAPGSDQSWLTIDGVSGGTVNFSFAANNSSASRSAHITLLGVQVTVNQGSLDDGFESGNFNALPWQLSSVGTATNWTVEGSNIHSGSFAAQSGSVSPGSNSTLSVTLALGAAGEFSFWRKVDSSPTGGSLIFEIDDTPQLQLSSAMPWQQSFYWVSAGQHTFSWVFAKSASAQSGSDAAYLDDVDFTPGATLTVNGSAANDVFTFDASSGSTIVVGLNGEAHMFPAGEFTNFVFHGNGGTDFASLTGSPSGNSVLLYTSGTGQLINSAHGYSVSLDGENSISAVGHSGDTAQFFDSAGNDTFYAYGDYSASGKELAGMYGSGYSNSASGFGTNIGTNQGGAAAGATDMAGFFDSPGVDMYYAYTNYDNSGQQLSGMYSNYGGGYSNTAKGFGTNVGSSTAGGSDLAAFYDSLGNVLYYAYADYGNSGQQLAGVLGHGYSDSARGFANNVAQSTAGSSDTAEFFDSPGNDTYFAYANYQGSGQTLAGMYGASGGGYSNSARGFATMAGNSTSGGSDTATLVGGASSDTLYTDAAIASLYGNDGSFSESASGFPLLTAIGGQSKNARSRGSEPLTYTLDLIGAWVDG